MVLVVGASVAVPAPMSVTSNWHEAKLPVACGTVTAMAEAFVNVNCLPQSVVATVYVVPVCALTASGHPATGCAEPFVLMQFALAGTDAPLIPVTVADAEPAAFVTSPEIAGD